MTGDLVVLLDAVLEFLDELGGTELDVLDEVVFAVGSEVLIRKSLQVHGLVERDMHHFR